MSYGGDQCKAAIRQTAHGYPRVEV
jgi:hypothetical protein